MVSLGKSVLVLLAILVISASVAQGHGDWDYDADVVVMGTGASGGALARAILDNHPILRVLMVEAGDNHDNESRVWDALEQPLQFDEDVDKYDWAWKTRYDPRKRSAGDIRAARMLGGSPGHNPMQDVHPSEASLAIWKIRGGSRWSVNKINQAIARLERFVDEETNGTLPGRGTYGHVDVRRPVRGPSSGIGSLANVLANWTAQASNLSVLADFNTPLGDGPGYGTFPRNDMFQTPERHRETASTAFLNDVMFPNGTGTGLGAGRLTVLLRTTGSRVLFNDNKRAIGLEAIKDGQTIRIRARKEVVLAGGMRSSHVLELSGIGNTTLLESLGIPVIVNNPNVGEHLKNHPSNIHLFVYSDFVFGAPTAPTDPAGLFGGGGFFPEMLANGSFAPADSSKSRDFQIVWSGTRFAPQILVLFVALDNPVSEGWVHAHSPDPLTNPFIDQRLAMDGDDFDRLVRFNYHFVQNTLTPYLQGQFFAAGGYLAPYGHDPWSNTTQAAEWTIANLIDASHYTGSNAMAPSAATGVVDGAGRVYGVNNLRVADSSIFPDITDANTALMSMVVGDILGRTIAGVA